MFSRTFTKLNLWRNIRIINTQYNIYNYPTNVSQMRLNRYLSQTKKKYNLEYTETGEWIYKEKDNFKIGLTKNSIEELNELVFIEYQYEVGDNITKGDELVSVESVKATNAIISPINCVINEINTDLENNLENVNQNPECTDTSWFMKLLPLD